MSGAIHENPVIDSKITINPKSGKGYTHFLHGHVYVMVNYISYSETPSWMWI